MWSNIQTWIIPFVLFGIVNALCKKKSLRIHIKYNLYVSF